MKKQTYYLIGSKRRSSGGIYFAFFCIVVFIVVFFPFYGMNLRYQIGFIFNQIFDTIGWISLTVGGLMVMISILGLFTGGRSMKFHYLIIGVVLLWIGCWCTGAVLDIFGVTIGSERASGGYH
ncbi:MAG: hypothetical protein ACXAAH_16880 [Promethearchaeota archaeon]|jgi:hypothetical protein